MKKKSVLAAPLCAIGVFVAVELFIPPAPPGPAIYIGALPVRELVFPFFVILGGVFNVMFSPKFSKHKFLNFVLYSGYYLFCIYILIIGFYLRAFLGI